MYSNRAGRPFSFLPSIKKIKGPKLYVMLYNAVNLVTHYARSVETAHTQVIWFVATKGLLVRALRVSEIFLPYPTRPDPTGIHVPVTRAVRNCVRLLLCS